MRDRQRDLAQRAPAGFAPIAIGLALTLFHLVAIPVIQRLAQPGALDRDRAVRRRRRRCGSLWLFWVAPIVGGVIGGIIGKWLHAEYVSGPTNP